jgi:hypothetical protein
MGLGNSPTQPVNAVGLDYSIAKMLHAICQMNQGGPGCFGSHSFDLLGTDLCSSDRAASPREIQARVP